MPALDLESLLSPLDAEAPCGANLEYDPAFMALNEAGSGKPEQQYGDTVIPATDPEWPAVYPQALQLAARTRDLRVAVWLLRSGARLHGLAGAVDGLRLLQGLLERHWAHVHPQLDDDKDPIARLNALAPLVHPQAGLADLRAATLGDARGGPTVRQVELGLGRAEPLPGESAPSEEGILEGVTAAIAKSPALAQQLQDGYQAVQAIATALEQHVDAGQSVEFGPAKKLLQRLAEAGQRIAGTAGADGDLPAEAQGAAGLPAGAGALRTREDAARALQRVCEWIEQNEPSNPAPLLIRRAQRLMSKNFLEIIRDLAPDGLSQVERLAGSNE